ncbi:MAG TPA: hypothetical protein VE733_20935, partial [Streptosporangiaceae bacterium]|nr:hypothetical protein [Streptosporangiaceae bacterium]
AVAALAMAGASIISPAAPAPVQSHPADGRDDRAGFARTLVPGRSRGHAVFPERCGVMIIT